MEKQMSSDKFVRTDGSPTSTRTSEDDTDVSSENCDNCMDVKMYDKSQRRRVCCGNISQCVWGVLLIVISVATFVFTPLDFMLWEKLNMRPGLPPYDWWADPPDEVRLRAYVFNITNHERFLNGVDTKLNVDEIGPVVYLCVLSCDNFTATSWPSSSDVEDNLKQCSVRGVDVGCTGTEATACSRWEYQVPDSFAAEFGLACEDWKLALVGTAHCFGNMLGQLVQGQISDRFGRKTAAVIAGTAGAVLGITKSFATSFWVYVALEALEAAIGDALSPMFMLSIEIVEKKSVVLFQMILLNCYTVGLIVMPFIAWAFPYWRYFLRIIYTPTLLILSYSFFLDESIRWLFSKGERQRAIRLIQKVAKRNGVEIDKATLNKMEYIDEETKSDISDKRLLLKTFKSRVMMKRFLVCMVWWFSITLINYGMMISSVFIDGNKYVNFALLMMMDIPANVFYWLALSKYKRKVPLFMSFIFGGLFCISQPFVPKGYAWVGLTLFMAFEMLATFSYNIVYMYTSELFPTYTRNSMHSICSAVGRLGSLLAPQTPLLISVWSGLPPFLFGVCSLASGALTLLMPETASCELPDTVAEAERIGREPSPAQASEDVEETGAGTKPLMLNGHHEDT